MTFMDINEKKQIFNEEALLNYVNNILYTRVGSIAFNREFGSYLEDYLFEPISETITMKIELEIYRALKKWLPEIIFKTKINTDYENSIYKININIFHKNISVLYQTELKQKA